MLRSPGRGPHPVPNSVLLSRRRRIFPDVAHAWSKTHGVLLKSIMQTRLAHRLKDTVFRAGRRSAAVEPSRRPQRPALKSVQLPPFENMIVGWASPGRRAPKPGTQHFQPANERAELRPHGLHVSSQSSDLGLELRHVLLYPRQPLRVGAVRRRCGALRVVCCAGVCALRNRRHRRPGRQRRCR